MPTPQECICTLGMHPASFTAQALLNTTIDSYKGIDLSEPALEIARDNIGLICSDNLFIEGDLFELVPELVKNQKETHSALKNYCAFMSRKCKVLSVVQNIQHAAG